MKVTITGYQPKRSNKLCNTTKGQIPWVNTYEGHKYRLTLQRVSNIAQKSTTVQNQLTHVQVKNIGKCRQMSPVSVNCAEGSNYFLLCTRTTILNMQLFVPWAQVKVFSTI